MARLKRTTIIQLEPLQDRCLPAVMVSLSGSEVSFLGDQEGGYLELSIDGSGYLQHNIESPELNSFIDLDPNTPGDQSLLASQVSSITVDLSASGSTGVFNGIKPPIIDFNGGQMVFNYNTITSNSTTLFSNNGFVHTSDGHTTQVNIHAASSVTMNLGSGNDYVNASALSIPINLYTYAGNDTCIGTAMSDTIDTGEGNDYLDGRAGDDYLYGDDYGQTGNDTILGGSGDDFLYGWGGNDIYDGGQGFDQAGEVLSAGTFIATKTSLNVDGFVRHNHHIEGFFVDGSAGNDLIDVRQLDSTCYINGYGGNDTVYGSSADDFIGLGDGNDYVDGRGGNDNIYGGNGNNTLIGGSGDDTLLSGDGIDSLTGGPGNDTLISKGGDDTLAGGAGNDILRGGNGHDVLNGDGGDDELYGEGDNDFMYGGAGNDLMAGDGHDYSDFNVNLSYSDVLYGEGGDDTLTTGGDGSILYGGAGDDYLGGTFTTGITTIYAGPGNDTIYASAFDFWDGGSGTDSIQINTFVTNARITNSTLMLDGLTTTRREIENFTIDGAYQCILDASGYTKGHVNFSGSYGDDILRGSENGDILAGGPGHDQLYGNAGDDLIRADGFETPTYDLVVLGGDGADTFEFYNTLLSPDATRQQLLDFLANAGVFHDLVLIDSFRIIND